MITEDTRDHARWWLNKKKCSCVSRIRNKCKCWRFSQIDRNVESSSSLSNAYCVLKPNDACLLDVSSKNHFNHRKLHSSSFWLGVEFFGSGFSGASSISSDSTFDLMLVALGLISRIYLFFLAHLLRNSMVWTIPTFHLKYLINWFYSLDDIASRISQTSPRVKLN